MTRYRCKHAVEAMRWDGESREVLTAWHEKKTGRTPWFFGSGIASVLCGDEWNDWHALHKGEWLVWSSGEFLVMDDEQFRETYEEVK